MGEVRAGRGGLYLVERIGRRPLTIGSLIGEWEGVGVEEERQGGQEGGGRRMGRE